VDLLIVRGSETNALCPGGSGDYDTSYRNYVPICCQPVGRPKEHDAATARALLDAAEEMIRAGGPAALTVRGVAEKVGSTTRAVYSLFGSRDGLLVALGVRAFELLGTAVRALPETDDPAADLVEAGVSVFRPFVVDHPALFGIGFRGFVEAELSAKFEAARLDALAGLVAKVDRLHQANLLGGRPVEEAVFAFDAVCEGLAELESRGRYSLSEDALAGRWRDTLTALVAGWRSTMDRRS
jgi:AcrR family transcriptional regulator